jgi:hypothetical protein
MHYDMKHGHESVVFGKGALKFGGSKEDFVLYAARWIVIVADGTCFHGLTYPPEKTNFTDQQHSCVPFLTLKHAFLFRPLSLVPG